MSMMIRHDIIVTSSFSKAGERSSILRKKKRENMKNAFAFEHHEMCSRLKLFYKNDHMCIIKKSEWL